MSVVNPKSAVATLVRRMVQSKQAMAESRDTALVSYGEWGMYPNRPSLADWETYVAFVYDHAVVDTKLAAVEFHHVFPHGIFPGLSRAAWNLRRRLCHSLGEDAG